VNRLVLDTDIASYLFREIELRIAAEALPSTLLLPPTTAAITSTSQGSNCSRCRLSPWL